MYHNLKESMPEQPFLKAIYILQKNVSEQGKQGMKQEIALILILEKKKTPLNFSVHIVDPFLLIPFLIHIPVRMVWEISEA